VGELYEHGQPESAALALERMCARLDPELRVRARAHAERSFDWASTFSAMVSLYQELVAAERI
jgi:hypothetical protein